MHPDLFRAHVAAVLSSGARVVGVCELVAELASPTGVERLVALTFDDGFASVARNAAPVLASSSSTTATVFCVPGHLGGRNDWASDPSWRVRLAARDGRRHSQALAAAGVEIGSHGFAHLPASEPRGVALEREIEGSREVLERLTGTESAAYAYPSVRSRTRRRGVSSSERTVPPARRGSPSSVSDPTYMRFPASTRTTCAAPTSSGEPRRIPCLVPGRPAARRARATCLQQGLCDRVRTVILDGGLVLGH